MGTEWHASDLLQTPDLIVDVDAFTHDEQAPGLLVGVAVLA